MQDLNSFKQTVKALEKKYGRDLGSVRILAVSKQQPIEKLQSLIHQGQLAFGENYLQEALEKISLLAEYPSLEWHFIGHMQTNKTRKIAAHFDWVQSVDSEEIAKRLHDQRPAHLPPLNICLEVNLHHEQNKSGISPTGLLPLANYCRTLSRLNLRGLMAIPAIETNFERQRATFHSLYQLYVSMQQQGFNLDTLSMGMSDDFEAAIAEGATLIRLGSLLFGERLSR